MALDIDATGGQFPIPIVLEEHGMRHRRSSLIGAIGLTAVSMLGPMARGDGLPITHELPLALALAAATEAMTTCEKGGYHVTVTVIDRAGQTKVQLHGDQAPPHTADSSRGKANTVVEFSARCSARTDRPNSRPPSLPIRRRAVLRSFQGF